MQTGVGTNGIGKVQLGTSSSLETHPSHEVQLRNQWWLYHLVRLSILQLVKLVVKQHG